MCGVSGCRYANISLHMQGSTRSCAASFDHRNIPRERGGHPFIHSEYRYPRIIFPANAGVFLVQAIFATVNTNIPRERGGLPQKSEKMTFTIEYSPRTRGSSHGAEVRHEIHHIPRERGGLPGYTFVLNHWCEYSPRTRGSSWISA